MRTHAVAASKNLLFVLVAGGLVVLSSLATACPFCTAVAPGFAQQRESAEIVVLAEARSSEAESTTFRLHRILKGESLLTDREQLTASVGVKLKPGQLALLLAGSAEPGVRAWSAMAVDETSVAYFVNSPDLRESEDKRLVYFAPFLEHPDPAIAEDAYREFGVARFESVRKVAERVPSDRLRTWLISPNVPQAHKGLYGLMLGLVSDKQAMQANADFLKQQILRDEDDFRAGFDGVIGGYLLLTGEPGLKLIEARFLANPKAAVGDVRHALTALRFYQQFGRGIEPKRLAAAVASTLDRPEFAEIAITDLARLQAWEFSEKIASLYDKPLYATSEIRRAIVGYLLACPAAAGRDELRRLRTLDPAGVAAAEEVLRKLGRAPQ